MRERLNDYLGTAARGTAGRLAAEAGISGAALSMFRSDTYGAGSEHVAAKLAEVLESREAADAILSGRFKPWWLVNTRTGLRIVKRRETVKQIRDREPDAYVIQVWRGPSPEEIHFVRGTGRDAF